MRVFILSGWRNRERGKGGLLEQMGGAKDLRLEIMVEYNLVEKEALIMKHF